MSAHLPTISRRANAEPYEGVEDLPRIPFNASLGTVYPNMYPSPGSTHPPIASLPNMNTTVPSIAISTRGPSHATTFRVHDTTSLSNLTTANSQHLARPMATSHRQQHLQPNREGHIGKKPSNEQIRERRHANKDPCIDRNGTVGHGESTWVNGETRPAQDPLYAARENFAVDVEKPLKLKDPGQNREHDCRPDVAKDLHVARVAPAVCRQYDQHNNQDQSLESVFSDYTYFDSPDSQHSQRNTVCLDPLHPCTHEFAERLSWNLVFRYLGMMEAEAKDKQFGSQPCETPSTQAERSSSSTVAGFSTSVNPSRTGSTPSSPGQLEAAALSSVGPINPAGKRQRSGYCSDRPRKRQRKDYTGVWNEEKCHKPCHEKLLDCSEEPRKRKKPNYEYICRICMIHAKLSPPLSNREALKCHIELMHERFLILFHHKEFGILEPQPTDRFENLIPLIRFCIPLQLQAQKCGVTIRPQQDLTVLYPQLLRF